MGEVPPCTYIQVLWNFRQTRRKRIMLAEKRRDTMLSLEGVALDGMRAYMYK